jgi:hypothetical protein
MAILSKDTLFGRVIVKKITLSTGDVVHIFPLPAREIVNNADIKMEKLIHRSLCDANGLPFFTGEDDTERTLTLPLADFNILAQAVVELNGMKSADSDAAGQAEKN